MTKLTHTKPTIDFKVNSQTGEAFISIRKTAELLNMPDTTLRDHLKAAHPNFDRKHGLTPEILQKVVNYRARQNSLEAISLQDKLAEAGAKAFIYHEAGYQVSASPIAMQVLPQDYVAALRQLAETEEKRLLLLEDNNEKSILVDSSNEYYTVRKMRSLNPDLKLDPKPLLKVSEVMGYPVKQVFDLYEQRANAYHRNVWEEVYPDTIFE